MAQTISELEKERAELLKAIENQAQSMSSTRERGTDSPEHTLKDWLTAAEEIMPSTPNSRSASSQPASKPSVSKNNSRASFFGVIIMLALLLTILGVVYIAYTSIHKELISVLSLKETTQAEMQQLKASVASLEKSDATTGKGDLFATLQARVDQLEAEVKLLKTQNLTSIKSGENETMPQTAVLPSNVVTTAVLDAKLQEYTKGIDAKLELILKHLNLSVADAEKVLPATDMQAKVTVSEPEITVPTEPDVKPLDQPVLTLVKKVEAPKLPEQPKDATEPLENYTSEVKWLMAQPAFNYTLQLASMSDRPSVQKMIEQKNLKGTQIIPQESKGVENFVLVSGSYATRQAAENAALAYKSEFKISPWIRKIKDITARVK